jgi:secreted Zn-dependent insulinase-like peptidase
MVNLYATVATEALTEPGVWHCDDGLPHTLEHLVFLGSEAYPYKGVLDKLANRCLAQGTNAWTDVDHTAYTVPRARLLRCRAFEMAPHMCHAFKTPHVRVYRL